jgi:hypothetical protein
VIGKACLRYEQSPIITHCAPNNPCASLLVLLSYTHTHMYTNAQFLRDDMQRMQTAASTIVAEARKKREASLRQEMARAAQAKLMEQAAVAEEAGRIASEAASAAAKLEAAAKVQAKNDADNAAHRQAAEDAREKTKQAESEAVAAKEESEALHKEIESATSAYTAANSELVVAQASEAAAISVSSSSPKKETLARRRGRKSLKRKFHSPPNSAFSLNSLVWTDELQTSL